MERELELPTQRRCGTCDDLADETLVWHIGRKRKGYHIRTRCQNCGIARNEPIDFITARDLRRRFACLET